MARPHLRPKRVLVTGGAGFIGSHLIDRLLERGDTVLCVDNLLTGSRDNIDHVASHPRFSFMQHDVTSPLDLQVDEIYNLACPASAVHYQHDPVQTTRTCVLGALNILDLARRLECKVFQASTSEVYGDPAIHPQPETYWGNVNPTGPRSCYNEGKRCAESLFFDHRRQYGLEIKVARIFNTFGPRIQPDDGRVVSNFIVQALRGQPITIFGDGSQSRSFCYVDDLVDGILRLMDTGPETSGPVNLGNPLEITIARLAELIAHMVGSGAGITHRDLPPDDPRHRQPDISLARMLIDWEPSVSLETGLKRTIGYFKDRLS